ncbi:probable purine permease 4 [Zingiber officinale]|uniref:probable purine permease 4 n=1 Tax=Zingiber officinale TaxID=94328 RepID=UPI001C4A7679|nr:probable purine permease 4 [Zingiber officinale]
MDNDGCVTKGARSNAWLLAGNYFLLCVGSLSSSLLSRFYFVHGGGSRWVSTLVQSAGFPLLLVPVYFCSSPVSGNRPFCSFGSRLLCLALGLGLLLGLNNLLFSCAVSYLSVSTSSLLLASQLAFTLLLSVVLVRHPVTFFNLNSVVLLTVSSVLLALNSSHDCPPGVDRRHFFLGLAAAIGAAALFAVYLPVMQLVYRGLSGGYRAVVEVQVVMEAAATALAVAGMAADGGGADGGKWWWPSEERWDLGAAAYWAVVATTVLAWQMCFMGTAGMVFLTSSVNGGICMTALLAVNVVGGVAAFGDEFSGGKAVAMALCLWGFGSYLYGEWKMKAGAEAEAPPAVVEEKLKPMQTAETSGDGDSNDGNV